ncbi:MAG: hypothetical protein F6K22_12890 [Okeania sp. SIO2F4]|uniref:hypothetical protein n=1 Tax=Okeania sp. SIO2F4 TaxID=2607790 RepID=UPI00142AD41C|nr:hypothetical protein [Okeania sp. SIO2F4]NES03660.1 hypothetical protein [Okeania sp. SIO2F4]
MNNLNFFKSPYFWCFCFTIIFLLSLDFWSWKQTISFSFLHLPPWVFYFIGLQIILACAILIFSQTFWKSETEEEN